MAKERNITLGEDEVVFSITLGNTLLLKNTRNSSLSDRSSGGLWVRIDMISKKEILRVCVLMSCGCVLDETHLPALGLESMSHKALKHRDAVTYSLFFLLMIAFVFLRSFSVKILLSFDIGNLALWATNREP